MGGDAAAPLLKTPPKAAAYFALNKTFKQPRGAANMRYLRHICGAISQNATKLHLYCNTAERGAYIARLNSTVLLFGIFEHGELFGHVGIAV